MSVWCMPSSIFLMFISVRSLSLNETIHRYRLSLTWCHSRPNLQWLPLSDRHVNKWNVFSFTINRPYANHTTGVVKFKVSLLRGHTCPWFTTTSSAICLQMAVIKYLMPSMHKAYTFSLLCMHPSYLHASIIPLMREKDSMVIFATYML